MGWEVDDFLVVEDQQLIRLLHQVHDAQHHIIISAKQMTKQDSRLK